MQSQETKSPRQMALLAGAIVILGAAGYLTYRQFGGESPALHSARRMFVCAETGKPFPHELQIGETEPIESPFTNRPTGYRAEACYWTKLPEGKWGMKDEPTWVLLKSTLDPETSEQTYCPDCGRPVWGHFPRPTAEAVAKANAESGD